jgi:hypothetical protein
MQPDEHGVCVTVGYPMRRDGSNYEAEAIVYIWGGRTVARFIAHGYAGRDARAVVERRAQAWLAADAETRLTMQRQEDADKNRRSAWWRKWWANDAA